MRSAETTIRSRFHLTTWSLMKIVFALACLFGFVGFCDRSNREMADAPRKSQCINNLKQIGLALHNYHEYYGCLPPAYTVDANGKPLVSWRALIVPFMENMTGFSAINFSEPWNGPNNSKLLTARDPRLVCPSSLEAIANPTLTSYVVITGPGTAFPGSKPLKFDDVKDGLANTLAVVEITNVEIPWTAPIDLDIQTMSLRINDPSRPGISTRHWTTANVLLLDGTCMRIEKNVTPEKLKEMITISGGESPVRQ